MEDNWQKGDLALSLHTWRQRNPETSGAPDAGSVHVVLKVVFNGCEVFLVFEPWPIDQWLASRFRKITPPKADEFDREIVDLMRGKKVPA